MGIQGNAPVKSSTLPQSPSALRARLHQIADYNGSQQSLVEGWKIYGGAESDSFESKAARDTAKHQLDEAREEAHRNGKPILYAMQDAKTGKFVGEVVTRKPSDPERIIPGDRLVPALLEIEREDAHLHAENKELVEPQRPVLKAFMDADTKHRQNEVNRETAWRDFTRKAKASKLRSSPETIETAKEYGLRKIFEILTKAKV